MFLRTNTLNSLMKQAYKSGMVVARTADGWIYLEGRYWEINIKEEFIPKKTRGDLIALVGELPEIGQRYQATKDGNQIEVEMKMRINDDMFGSDTLTVTDVILLGKQGTAQRLLQDDNTGEIYAVNNVFINIVDDRMIEADKGEYAPGDPLYSYAGILWKNNVCKLHAHFRDDEKNQKVMENLKGIDIRPEAAEG